MTIQNHRLLFASSQYSKRLRQRDFLLSFPAPLWSTKRNKSDWLRQERTVSTLIHSSLQGDNNHSDGEQQLIDYCRSWAWQHLILNRRLEAKRRRAATTSISSSNQIYEDDNVDHILLLEHKPVYTLGRGSNEEYITFLQENNSSNGNVNDEAIEQENMAKRILRQRLSRSSRGPGSARLSIDQQHRFMEQDYSSLNDKAIIIDRLSSTANPVLAPNGAPIYRVERGGEVTFHGPSILCVYPMMNLERGPPYKQDLHWFLRNIEEVIIQTLDHYGIHGAYRDNVNTGVWIKDEEDETATTSDCTVQKAVSENKVAAVGVTASRWITTHGFAINIDPDLSWFDTSIILPCGIHGRGVTSMGEILRKKQRQQQNPSSKLVVPTTKEVATVVVQKMQAVFDIDHIVPGHSLY